MNKSAFSEKSGTHVPSATTPGPRLRVADMQRPGILRRLLGLRHSCTFQLYSIMFILVAIPLAYFWSQARPEDYNPYGVTGSRCKYGDIDSYSEDIGGTFYTLYQVNSEDRMSEGQLLMLEKGGDTEKTHTLSLPSGKYTLAYRFQPSAILRANTVFSVHMQGSDGYSRAYRQVIIAEKNWHASRHTFEIPTGTYQIEITAPSDSKWCVEIARTERSTGNYQEF